MRIIYRVETNEPDVEDRTGAYRGYNNIVGLAGLGDIESANHPVPEFDAGLCNFWENVACWERQEYLFGFKDLGQYSNWFMFPEENVNLIGLAVIGVYRVDEGYGQVGQFQAIAHRSHMTHLHDLCPHTMEKLP